MDLEEKQIALVFKAFCDENRIRILALLTTGEKCACKLLEALNITQPTLSHDMRVLLQAGIVNDRREGKNTYYSLNTARLSEFERVLHTIMSSKADCICHGAGCCE